VKPTAKRRRETDRRRLRRRLLILTAPLAVTVVILSAKLISVVLAGGWAVTDYSHHNAAALAHDVSILRLLNVAEPAKAFYADGTRAVLQDRLGDADRQFTLALGKADPDNSCPVRVDLELVRETLGDRASAASDRDAALGRYTAARTMVQQAPTGCFSGNADPDVPRRMIREDALRRLDAKIEALRTSLPPPDRTPVPPPPPNAPVSGDTAPSPRTTRADPPRDDPMAGLAQILRDGTA
jgi:hypothetical protein